MMTSGSSIIRSLRDRKELEKQLAFEFARKKTGPPYTLTCEHDQVILHLDVEDFDRLGVMLRGMRLVVASASGDSGGFDWLVARLENSLTHLNGGLQLIEMENEVEQAILRTAPTENDSRSYFELTIKSGTEMMLWHFTVDSKTQKRVRTSANMSMESFALLIDRFFELLSAE